jgi:hypothetical protein
MNCLLEQIGGESSVLAPSHDQPACLKHSNLQKGSADRRPYGVPWTKAQCCPYEADDRSYETGADSS